MNHDDVIACMMRLPDRQSFCDALPSSVLKKVAAEVSPFLTHLFNRSFSTGVFSSRSTVAADCSDTDAGLYHSCCQNWNIVMRYWPAFQQIFFSSAVGSQCSSQDHHRSTSLSAYQHDACRSSLASSCWTHQVPTGDSGVPLSPWYSPPLPLGNFIRVADIPARRRLRSSTTNSLIVRPTRLVTVGDRAFPVAGANLWNSLSDDITALDSQVTFRRQLKTSLFRVSYLEFCCYRR